MQTVSYRPIGRLLMNGPHERQLLAATGKVNGMTLVTRNTADVADLGAKVLNSFEARNWKKRVSTQLVRTTRLGLHRLTSND